MENWTDIKINKYDWRNKRERTEKYLIPGRAERVESESYLRNLINQLMEGCWFQYLRSVDALKSFIKRVSMTFYFSS